MRCSSMSGLRYVVNNWTTTIKSPAVSPDGLEVAYDTQCYSGYGIWLTSFDLGTDPCQGNRLTAPEDADSKRPAWGPDDLIVFEHVSKITNVSAIAVISDQLGSATIDIMADGSDNRDPAWLPGP